MDGKENKQRKTKDKVKPQIDGHTKKEVKESYQKGIEYYKDVEDYQTKK